MLPLKVSRRHVSSVTAASLSKESFTSASGTAVSIGAQRAKARVFQWLFTVSSRWKKLG